MIFSQLRDVPLEQDVRELFVAFFLGQSSSHVPEQDAMISCITTVEAEAGNGEAGRLGTYHAALLADRGERFSFESSWFSERLTSKDRLEQVLYRTLSVPTGKKFLWDALTGTCPVKLILNLLQRGKTVEEVRAESKRDLFLSNARNTLCIRTAENELCAIRGFDFTVGYSPYIGIPFYPATYLYCSLLSCPAEKNKAASYLATLREEPRLTAGMMAGRCLDAVYMGGGTPISPTTEEFRSLLPLVCETFDFSVCWEFAVEVGRPDSITREELLALREAGVDRIGISPQTLKQVTLDLIGCFRMVEQFMESFALARESGFGNINTDLTVGLPDETGANIWHTMESICALSPDDVTVHSLALKRAACLNTKREDYRDVRYGDANQMMKLAASYCKEIGLSPYYLYRQKDMAGNLENVGWCRLGKEGFYNILIVEELETIVGCGADMTTRVTRGEGQHDRLGNVKDPALYVECLPELFAKRQRAFAGDVLG